MRKILSALLAAIVITSEPPTLMMKRQTVEHQLADNIYITGNGYYHSIVTTSEDFAIGEQVTIFYQSERIISVKHGWK